MDLSKGEEKRRRGKTMLLRLGVRKQDKERGKKKEDTEGKKIKKCTKNPEKKLFLVGEHVSFSQGKGKDYRKKKEKVGWHQENH